MPGRVHVYKFINTTCDTNEVINYPTELLSTLEPFGIHSQKLEQKTGAPISLLRNIQQTSLCKGTILCIKKLMPNIMEAAIMTGHATGKNISISRILIIRSLFI